MCATGVCLFVSFVFSVRHFGRSVRRADRKPTRPRNDSRVLASVCCRRRRRRRRRFTEIYNII